MMDQEVILFASGDLRRSANLACWPAQQDLERRLTDAFDLHGLAVRRGHPYKSDEGHGFLASQREGMDAFVDIDPDASIVVAVAAWQYSHHVLAGLTSHRGPILTVANWSGQWPGLVGMLNLNGSLTKAGVIYSTLWSETFDDSFFSDKLREWVGTGHITHDESHVSRLPQGDFPAELRTVLNNIRDDLLRRKTIIGVFDEGCMGMYNAVVPDELLMKLGMFKERLSQSALYFATKNVSNSEGRACLDWLKAKGMTFHFGTDEASELTEAQVIEQCKTYIAAVQLAEEFGCEAIGIQYQQGLKDSTSRLRPSRRPAQQ